MERHTPTQGETQMTRTKQRATIKAHAQSKDCRYRITSRGEVDFYGWMPNADEHGWYLFAMSVPEALGLIERDAS
jgi:hypothetical protein